MVALDEASVVGVFPHRKAGTRRPPGIEYLGVGARAAPQPINEIKYQAVEVVSHKGPVNHRRSAEAELDGGRASSQREPLRPAARLRRDLRAQSLAYWDTPASLF